MTEGGLYSDIVGFTGVDKISLFDDKVAMPLAFPTPKKTSLVRWRYVGLYVQKQVGTAKTSRTLL